MKPNFARRVVALINQERTKADLDPLKINSQLALAARQHTKSMANNDFFSHYGVNGSSPFERIENTGYEYSIAAENIAAGYQTPETVVRAWMGSTGHRANILNSDITEIGVGYRYFANDSGLVNYNHYWTTTFGSSD